MSEATAGNLSVGVHNVLLDDPRCRRGTAWCEVADRAGTALDVSMMDPTRLRFGRGRWSISDVVQTCDSDEWLRLGMAALLHQSTMKQFIARSTMK